MHEKITNHMEKKETLDDNARKFVLAGIDAAFLHAHDATSFRLVADWLATGEDDEIKLAYKTFSDSKVQILRIAKVTKDGHRTAEKESITKELYDEYVAASILRSEKTRYEFTYAQGSMMFTMKYDEFAEDGLCMLEVDAASEAEREVFKSGEFPYELTEVTGNAHYYGYRLAERTTGS